MSFEQDRVNNLLHTLRGEQFRHSQNVLRSRTHISSSYTHNARTLPQGLIALSRASNIDTEDPVHAVGPPDPVNGTTNAYLRSPKDRDSHWRAHALSVIYDDLSSKGLLPTTSSGSVPALTLLCLRILFSTYSSPDFAEDVLPFLPPHLRRDLLRYTSIYSPLANPGSLCQPNGHADGELIIIGPYASLRGDYFRRRARGRAGPQMSCDVGGAAQVDEPSEKDEEELSWDSPTLHDEWTSTSLHTLALLSVNIPNTTFLTFPPTITHLALVELPSAVPLHRLPGICPLITVVDLSYNKWLGTMKSTTDILGRVVWTRWSRLEVLGLRECRVTEELRRKVNEGRWTDVVII